MAESKMTCFRRFRSGFRLLYILVGLNIFFFLLVYQRLVIISPHIPTKNQAKTGSNDYFFTPADFSSQCPIPKFDPWDPTIAKSLRIQSTYRCQTKKQNLINVINSTQLQINQTVNRISYSNAITHCIYLKINRNPNEKYFRDWSYTLSDAILIDNGLSRPIDDADFVLTRCFNNRKGFFQGDQFW